MEDEDTYTVTIVGTGETGLDFDQTLKTDKDAIKISFESPMGMAMKGKKA